MSENHNEPIIKFTEPTPLYDGSYENAVQWWHFYNKCMRELNKALLNNDIEKVFIYEQVVKIVKSDGIRS